jgi:hypothetical protein
MILKEITSNDIKITSFFDEFTTSQIIERSIFEPEKSSKKKTYKISSITFPVERNIKIENLSSIYQPPKFETKTVLTEDIYQKEQREIFIKIKNMIKRIMEEEKNLFEEINIDNFLSYISKMINESTVEWEKISDNDLYKRLKGIMAIEAMSKLLKDLTPEEKKAFESTLKRRPIFE